MDADRLRDKAKEYDLRARALADQEDNPEAQLSALTFSAVSMALYELADLEEAA